MSRSACVPAAFLLIFAGCAGDARDWEDPTPAEKRTATRMVERPGTIPVVPPTSFVEGNMNLRVEGEGVRELLVASNGSFMMRGVGGPAGRSIAILAPGIDAPWNGLPCQPGQNHVRVEGFGFTFGSLPAGTYRLVVATVGDSWTNATVSFGGGPSTREVGAQSMQSNRTAVTVGYQRPTPANPLDVEYPVKAREGDYLVSQFDGFALAGAGMYEISSSVSSGDGSACAHVENSDVFAHALIYGYGAPVADIDTVLPPGEFLWRGHFATTPPAVTSTQGFVVLFQQV